jgi:hypothetical protein
MAIAYETLGLMLGRYREAEALLRRVVETWTRLLGASHPGVCRARVDLVSAMIAQTRIPEALQWLREAVDLGCSEVETIPFDRFMKEDVRLRGLHGTPEFESIVATCQRLSRERERNGHGWRLRCSAIDEV